MPPSAKAPITTHILDLHTGTPAKGVLVSLYSPLDDKPLCSASTNDDGRVLHWPEEFTLHSGIWTLVFHTQDWFKAQQRSCFFADIRLPFVVDHTDEHYHVPLLLNQFGFSSYRGS